MSFLSWLRGDDADGNRLAAGLSTSGLTDPYSTVGPLSPFHTDDTLERIVWAELANDPTALAPVSRAEAMSVPAFARARHVLCSTIARCDLRAVRGPLDAPVAVDPQPSILVQPDPAQSRFVQLVWTVDDLVWHGRSVWVVLRRLAGTDGAPGYPADARRIAPHRVRTETRRNAATGLAELVWYVDDVEWPERDLILIDGPHEGVLTFGARSVRSAADIERGATKAARTPIPAVELHATTDYPFTDPEIDALIARWAKARQGENGGVAWTSRDVEARMHGAASEHLLVEGRNAAAVDAARLVSVPADVVDAAPAHASMTYANVESRNRTLIDYGVAAYAAAIEARLSCGDVLPYGQRAAFDLSQLTAPSTAADPTVPSPAPAAPGVPSA